MKWRKDTEHRLISDCGYMICKYAMQEGWGYVVHTPEKKLLHSGFDGDKAKAACIEHFESKQGVAA